MSEQEVPGPPEGSKAAPSWAVDLHAVAEERNWPDERKLREVELNNQIWVQRVLGIIVPALMLLFTSLFAGSLLAWVWHYLTPWPWLSSDQLSKIQSVLFSGGLGALVSSYVQRHILR
jgi:hypothetical protein